MEPLTVAAVALAAAALAASLVALRRTALAARSARSAATAAERAAATAAAQLDLLTAERARSTERSDVEWALEVDGGRIAVRNVGTTTAHEAIAVLDIDAHRREVDADRVPRDEAIVLDANDIYRDAVEVAQSRKDALAQAGIASMAIVRLQVKGRISWVSPLGTPGVQLLDKEHTRKARREH